MYARKAFTMIELTFVIVIIGIIAAIAIPKLAATRDDAAVVSEINNASQVLMNLGSEYMGQGAFVNYLEADANSATKCFSYKVTTDGNVTVFLRGVYDNCPTVLNKSVKSVASKNGLLNINGSEKTYQFGSATIKH